MNRPEPLNILYCEGNIDKTVGGSYHSLFQLVSGLDKTLYRPLVVFYHDHALIKTFHEHGVDVRVIQRPLPFRLPRPGQGVFSMISPMLAVVQKCLNVCLFYLVLGWRYAAFLKEHKIAILHLNNSIIRNHEWMLAARLAGIPCLTHERGINNHYPLLARLHGRRLAAVICISEAVRKHLVAHRIEWPNLVMIYNGIDPDQITVEQTPAALRKRHGLPDKAPIIGVVGNIKPWKGQESAIRAMVPVLAAHPETVCLFIGDVAAPDIDYQNSLIALAQQLGIADHIVFTGYTKQVADYYNLLAVVLHTSVEPEPFGRVLIEAMALRKPVIGTRAGAVPEIIDENVTGYTVVPDDHAALAEHIIALLADPEKAKCFGEAGYRRLVERFHLRANVSATQRLYETVIARS